MIVKISVVVPVYLVAPYLKKCIESVLNQDYQNVEIILVDDGSFDESSIVCDQYAAKHKNVMVIHKRNGGASSARNAGLERATGDYIMFLDGDDFWDDCKAVSRLVKRLEITKVDVLNFSYKKYFESSNKKIPYFKNYPEMPLNKQTKEEQLAYLTEHNLYIASACNKVIRREILNEKMRFCEGIHSEDIEWCARLLIFAKSMDFICENFYCYRQRKDSTTHTINEKKCKDLCDNILKCISFIELANEQEREYIRRYIAYQYGTFFRVQAQADDEPSECIRKLSKFKWILSYHCGNRKLIILYICCCFLGYEKTCKVIRRIYSKWR